MRALKLILENYNYQHDKLFTNLQVKCLLNQTTVGSMPSGIVL
ncbi:hypothetical protein ABH899_001188 [Paenibacillus sp. RC84]